MKRVIGFVILISWGLFFIINIAYFVLWLINGIFLGVGSTAFSPVLIINCLMSLSLVASSLRLLRSDNKILPLLIFLLIVTTILLFFNFKNTKQFEEAFANLVYGAVNLFVLTLSMTFLLTNRESNTKAMKSRLKSRLYVTR